MQPQQDTERDWPDSNTLGGTSSAGADGQNGAAPAPTTPGLDLSDTNEAARRFQQRNAAD